MLTLLQFPRIWGLPNGSPFCAKLETYLRLANIEYDIHFVFDPRKSPKGKLPCIEYQGRVIPDSDLIIDFLKSELGDVLDLHLTAQQKNHAYLLNTLFSEKVYWLMLYFRWADDAGWKQVKPAYFSQLSWFSSLFLPQLIRNNMKKMLTLQGTGRHSREELIAMGKQTIDVIADELGEQKYFMGEQPTSIDATAFGFLCNFIALPYSDPLADYTKQKANLMAYCERMWNSCFPELKN